MRDVWRYSTASRIAPVRINRLTPMFG